MAQMAMFSTVGGSREGLCHVRWPRAVGSHHSRKAWGVPMGTGPRCTGMQ